MIDRSVVELAPMVGTAAACVALGRARATHYRRHRTSPAPMRPAPIAHADRVQPAALSAGERARVLAVLHCERFADAALAQVWATLLDEGVYLASEATFYRLMRAEHGDMRERRFPATHPARVKPELIATGPNTVWSWDITKLHGPAKWTYFYLYAVVDVYSGKAVGWMVATRESAALAEALLAETIAAEGVPAAQLTIHSDNGTSMASKTVAPLLADLGVVKSHSRPHVSNDNPLDGRLGTSLAGCPTLGSARQPGTGVGQSPVAGHRRRRAPLPELVHARLGVAHDVPHGPATGGQRVGDEQSMAAPRHRLGTHENDAAISGELEKLIDPVLVRRQQCVVRIVLEARVLPARVDVAVDILLATTSTEVLEVDVGDRGPLEPSRHHVAPELRTGPRPWVGSDVGEHTDVVFGEPADERRLRTGPVPDRPDLPHPPSLPDS